MVDIGSIINGAIQIGASRNQEAANDKEFEYLDKMNQQKTDQWNQQMAFEKNIEGNNRRENSLTRLTMTTDKLKEQALTDVTLRNQLVKLFSGGK